MLGITHQETSLKNNNLVAISGTGNRRCLNGSAVDADNVLENNHYYTTDDADPIYWAESGAWSGSLAEFKAAFSNKYEQDSPAQADPKFISATNYHLQNDSTCIGTGEALASTYAEDFDGDDQRDCGDWDIGADAWCMGRRIVYDSAGRVGKYSVKGRTGK